MGADASVAKQQHEKIQWNANDGRKIHSRTSPGSIRSASPIA